jgi:hypothetical protein
LVGLNLGGGGGMTDRGGVGFDTALAAGGQNIDVCPLRFLASL